MLIAYMIKILSCNDSQSTFHVTTMRLQFSKLNTKLGNKSKYWYHIRFCIDTAMTLSL